MAFIYFDCRWRKPCPICRRCMAYAPHRYARCRTCVEGFKPCHHDERHRNVAILRKNFRLVLPEKVKQELDAVLNQRGGADRGQG